MENRRVSGRCHFLVKAMSAHSRRRPRERAASGDPVVRLVPLDKSEGVVKTEISWAVREHRLLCQRRLRTKTLEISPESLCGGIVPPTIAYPDIVRIESSPRVPLVGAS